MTYFADILLRAEVSRTASVRPLVKYLRDNKPFTDYLRAWLIELLEHKKKTPIWLKLMRAPGRRHTDENMIEAYFRVKELRNSKMTGQVFWDIVKNLDGRDGQIERPYTKHKRIDNVVYKPAIYRVRKNYVVEFTFIEGRRLAHDVACKIAARQFGLSFSYVKRKIREIDSASQ